MILSRRVIPPAKGVIRKQIIFKQALVSERTRACYLTFVCYCVIILNWKVLL